MTGRALDVLVVGSANADLTVTVARRPAAGETVLGGDLATTAGGKGANQAVAAARLGARVGLLARVGDDAHGRLVSASLREAGVDTARLLTGAAPTGVALITVDGTGDNAIVVSPGANAHLSPADVAAAEEPLRSARVVSLQLEIPQETAHAAVRAAVRAGTRVVLNPSPPAELPDDVLAGCDPLVVNAHEARRLLAAGPALDTTAPASAPADAADQRAAAGRATEQVPEGPPGRQRPAEQPWAGPQAAERQAAALLERGPRSVVVTLGPDGAVLATAAGVLRVPSPRVHAVDSTGAGDAFTGALAWRLATGDPLPDAVRFAVRVGAAATVRAGAQAAFPTPEELPAAPAPHTG